MGEYADDTFDSEYGQECDEQEMLETGKDIEDGHELTDDELEELARD